ncbi:hypothetical protein ACFL6C_04865 [Myxococcota bacterium]
MVVGATQNRVAIKPPDWCGTKPKPVQEAKVMTQAQKTQLDVLIAQYKDVKNTSKQLEGVDKMYALIRNVIIGNMPGKKYMVIQPQELGKLGLVDAKRVVDANNQAFNGQEVDVGMGRARDAVATQIPTTLSNSRNSLVPLDDDYIRFYLVVPPPPDPDQKLRHDKLGNFDLQLDSIFGNLITTLKKTSADKAFDPDEIENMMKLQSSMVLCAKIFLDDVGEYYKDYPLAPDPQQRDIPVPPDPGLP